MSEILIISILITVWLFIVRNSIDHAKKTNENVKQSVIANQIATEWAELVYQLRNTNILEFYYNDYFFKTGNDFNRCRLSYDFTTCAQWRCPQDSSERCTDADRIIIKDWYYYISENWEIKNCYCDDNSSPAEKERCNDIKNKKYAICLNNWVRVPCPEWHEAWHDQSRYGKFYRMIEGIWIYDMSENEIAGWKKIESSFCSLWNTQEYRFCSRVAREWGWWLVWWGEVEICSTMTNFAKLPQ